MTVKLNVGESSEIEVKSGNNIQYLKVRNIGIITDSAVVHIDYGTGLEGEEEIFYEKVFKSVFYIPFEHTIIFNNDIILKCEKLKNGCISLSCKPK